MREEEENIPKWKPETEGRRLVELKSKGRIATKEEKCAQKNEIKLQESDVGTVHKKRIHGIWTTELKE